MIGALGPRAGAKLRGRRGVRGAETSAHNAPRTASPRNIETYSGPAKQLPRSHACRPETLKRSRAQHVTPVAFPPVCDRHTASGRAGSRSAGGASSERPVAGRGGLRRRQPSARRRSRWCARSWGRSRSRGGHRRGGRERRLQRDRCPRSRSTDHARQARLQALGPTIQPEGVQNRGSALEACGLVGSAPWEGWHVVAPAPFVVSGSP